MKKCSKGTHRNKKTGVCEPIGFSKLRSSGKPVKCPKGTRKNKKTGNCEPHPHLPQKPKNRNLSLITKEWAKHKKVYI